MSAKMLNQIPAYTRMVVNKKAIAPSGMNDFEFDSWFMSSSVKD